MDPHYQAARIRIFHGSCEEVLRTMPDNSVDSIVTDPPYGLSFMGKKWDYDVPSVEIWEECLRVLKPGGHLLAFAGTRTQHRMAVRIEDAGFEIRDMIGWLYGSGFPKSLNIGKAVDKLGQNPYGWIEFSKAYKKIVEESQYNHNDIDNHLGIKASSCYWARTDNRGGLPPRHHWEKVKEFVGLDSRYDELYDEVEREIVGLQKKAMSGWNMDGTTQFKDRDVTKGTSEWEGWGTALKPAWECITVARKPLIGTVASNVLQYGTGGINIDGCRVGTEILPAQVAGQAKIGTFERHDMLTPERIGRFPANIIHDGSDEVVRLFPDNYGDSGSAARFFYCAKASKSDRDEGNNHATVKPTALMQYLVRLVTPPGGTTLDPFAGSGSTGKAAVREGFGAILIERDIESVEIAIARISAEQAKADKPPPPDVQLNLFS